MPDSVVFHNKSKMPVNFKLYHEGCFNFTVIDHGLPQCWYATCQPGQKVTCEISWFVGNFDKIVTLGLAAAAAVVGVIVAFTPAGAAAPEIEDGAADLTEEAVSSSLSDIVSSSDALSSDVESIASSSNGSVDAAGETFIQKFARLSGMTVEQAKASAKAAKVAGAAVFMVATAGDVATIMSGYSLVCVEADGVTGMDKPPGTRYYYNQSVITISKNVWNVNFSGTTDPAWDQEK